MIDTFMVLLFPFLDFIPFAVPRYLMFRDKLRIPFKYVMVLIISVSALNSLSFYLINAGGYEMAVQWTTLMRYVFMLINLTLSFALIRESFPKLMFTYLLIFAWSFFVFGNANFIESRFFWDFSDRHPYLVYNIARVIIYLITCPILLRFFSHTIMEAMKIQDTALWKHLWKIPLFSALFGMLYCFNDDIYAYATWQFIISRYLMLFGTCYVSYVALKVLELSKSRTQLEDALKYADQSIMAQKKQFDSLSQHMGAMRKARHDLRQHLAVVQSYIDKDDRTGLKNYIDLYRSELPPDILESYCHNDVVDAIVCYYAGMAKDYKILFDTKIDYPDSCPITETDMTVLLGNLLENAVEACQRQSSGQKFIKLRIKRHGSSELLILTDNSCTIPVTFQDGIPMSSKRKGMGVGASSIQDIAERYHGTVRFEWKEDVFYASVLLQYENSGDR
ncbi:GHKL domain-containing protein [Clostridium sp. AF19-22AC]|jgi:two-component system sensor histidine kinase AgrC|uniref:ATP-binding protein n=1 Tax=Clostridia TaxID=186801 RepID=UPI000E5106B0|nr:MULTISPECIES: sensor histidine kinase [Clostridia]RHR22248.1 GHKL domain-containing protein [Clostridium sp. AF19-22AC]